MQLLLRVTLFLPSPALLAQDLFLDSNNATMKLGSSGSVCTRCGGTKS